MMMVVGYKRRLANSVEKQALKKKIQKLLEQELIPETTDRKDGILDRIRKNLAAGGDKHDEE